MKKQNIQAEIDFFNKSNDGNFYDTLDEKFYNIFFKKIRHHLVGNILEAGCGSGSFGIRMKKINPEIKLLGIDLNKNFIELAIKSEAYEKLLAEDLEKSSLFEENSFDVIICPYILHHFPDIKQAMNNFHLWLKPGGCIIILDPNGSNLILRISYIFRIIIEKMFIQNKYASINESHKTICDFKKNLKMFSIESLITLDCLEKNFIFKKNKTFIDILFNARTLLLKIYARLPFVRYGGSQVLIIAQKK